MHQTPPITNCQTSTDTNHQKTVVINKVADHQAAFETKSVATTTLRDEIDRLKAEFDHFKNFVH